MIHGLHHVLPVRVELRWEDLAHRLASIGLVHPRGRLNEACQILVATHRLIQCRQEVLVELLFGFLVQLVVLLKESLLGAQHVHGVLPGGRSYPLALVAATVRRCESLDLLYDGLPRVDL